MSAASGLLSFVFFFIFYFSAGNRALSFFIIDMGKVGKLDGSEDGSAPSGARGGLDGGGGWMRRGKEQQRHKRKRGVWKSRKGIGHVIESEARN